MTAETTASEISEVTIGVTGQVARWSVSPWGSVAPWGTEDPVPFDWFVAADDRWHVPSREPTVRQRRIEGTPVLETRVRIPDGDAVQRVWAVPDADGSVVVEFENESPMPVAVAVTGSGIVTERPPADVDVQGIELPSDAIVLPLGHRATVRIAMSAAGSSPTLSAVPPALSVVRGWTSVVEHASRLVLPDEPLVDALVAARCDLLLEGPVDVGDDPVGFLLDVGELVRCGDSADAWLLDVVAPTEDVARSAAGRRGSRRLVARRSSSDPDVGALDDVIDALAASRLVAARAGDRRAVGDIDALVARVRERIGPDVLASTVPSSFADLRRGASVGRFTRAVERRIASRGRLLVGGIPSGWLGHDFEVHHLPTGTDSSVSFALRWHGERPAVLWEQHGEQAVVLTAPDVDPSWSSEERSGEALWAAPPSARPASRSVRLDVDPGGASFS